MREMPVKIKTGRKEIDELPQRIQRFLEADIMVTHIDGQNIRGFRSPDSKAIWIRDHSDILRGGKFFEPDMTSAVRHFADTQAKNGRIFDYFTSQPEKVPCEKENWTKYVRVPVEADVEFRFIKATYLAWQASGDDNWLEAMIQPMIRALDYIFSNPDRYDQKTGLVKRAYTIDTWDFAYTAGKHPWLQFQIDEDTFWGIFHGDNSGYYEALLLLSRMLDHLKKEELAAEFSMKARYLRDRCNDICWNDRFYTHFVKLTPCMIKEVDESQQLSMSNAMNINRGICSHNQAVSIINEYIEREKHTGAFAGWFSIDPPFPAGIFGDEKLIEGAYINGGIFPLAGGELARAAFEHGFESYGVAILQQYYDLISEKDESYLWYFPDGTPSSTETSTSPDAMPTDGWGSSAMLYALIEGLAGVVDEFKCFRKLRISPRWPKAGIHHAEIRLEYPASGSFLEYTYESKMNEILMTVKGEASEVFYHVLLPDSKTVTSVTCNQKPVSFTHEKIGNSPYVNFKSVINKKSDLQIHFEP